MVTYNIGDIKIGELPYNLLFNFDIPRTCDECPLYLHEFDICGIFPTSRWGADEDSFERWFTGEKDLKPTIRSDRCPLKEWH